MKAPDALCPAVLGLGYVGLPLALALARLAPTLGHDVDAGRIAELRAGHDRSGECTAAELSAASGLRLVADPLSLSEANVFLIAVPTPIAADRRPDFGPLLAATRVVAGCLKRGDVVIYESTVYPGATEEVCVPVLEQTSGLKLDQDFWVGYSPERINPGDRARRLPDIVKVTSGSCPEAAEFIDALYRKLVPAGTWKAPSIRVAEAAKAVENIQRDVNIALTNELAQIFGKLGIDTEDVLRAAGSKWNFLPFRPGLVGGHCIGVDPYYLIHKARMAGHEPQLMLAARQINEGMSDYVTGQLLDLLARRGIAANGCRLLVLGATFKEDCADLRNTRVVEIVAALRGRLAQVDVHDPWADAAEWLRLAGAELESEPGPGSYDAVLIAVAHRQFRDLGVAGVRRWLRPGGVVYDLKHVLPASASELRL